MNSNNIFKQIYFKVNTTDFEFYYFFKNFKMKTNNFDFIFLMGFEELGNFKFVHHNSSNKTMKYEFK